MTLDFTQAQLHRMKLSIRQLMLHAAQRISSPATPGPFYRRQLFLATQVEHELEHDEFAVLRHPMTYQATLNDMVKEGLFARPQGAGAASYTTTERAFAESQRLFGAVKQLWRPVLKSAFSGSGRVNPDLCLEDVWLDYTGGRLVAVRVAKETFRNAVDARGYIREHGLWRDDRDDWLSGRAVDALELLIVRFDPHPIGAWTP